MFANNNYAAGQSIGMSGMTHSYLNVNTTVASATPYQFTINGTSCGNVGFTQETGQILEVTTGTTSCSSNICTVPTGNSNISIGDDVAFNTGTSPSCMSGHVYRAISGTNSSQIV